MKNPIHPYMIYTTEEVASLLSVSPITIQRYIRNGKLFASRVGNDYRISGSTVIEFMSLDAKSIQLPQNRVRKIENTNYVRAEAFLLKDRLGVKYIELFALTCNSILASLEPRSSDNEDQLSLKYIGSRIFNSAMVAYRDALSGYYQASFMSQRDLLEISFLVDYFRTYPEEIKLWREAPATERKKKFKAFSIREALDERDSFKDRKRYERYEQLCEYAVHISFPGMQLLANTDNQIEIGPFYDESKILNTMHDLCLHFGLAVAGIQASIKVPGIEAAQQWLKHMQLFDEVFEFRHTEQPKFIEAKKHIEELIQQISKSRDNS